MPVTAQIADGQLRYKGSRESSDSLPIVDSGIAMAERNSAIMKTRLLSIAIALNALSPGVAQALGESCTVGSTPTAFGIYLPGDPSPSDTVGSVSVTCSAVVALLIGYTVGLGPGIYGSFAQRSLGSGSNRMAYQLYMDPGRSVIWGDGTAGTAARLDGYLLQLLVPVTLNYSVYGRIPGGQNVAPGSYADAVTVMLTF
ncbi:hypothetical protein BH10PSE17_BH10PSE17_00890 [soil metagenome]